MFHVLGQCCGEKHDTLAAPQSILYLILILTRVTHCKKKLLKADIRIWIYLILICVLKLSKSSPTHLLWVITWNLLSICFHSLQKTFSLGLTFTIIFLSSAQPFANIVNLWYYWIKQSPKLNWNHIELTEPLTYRQKFSWIIHLYWFAMDCFSSNTFLRERSQNLENFTLPDTGNLV